MGQDSRSALSGSIHPISQHRTTFQIVMGLNLGRQEKDLTQFQQLILIIMTKKKKQVAGDTRVDIIIRFYVAEYVKFHCISLI